MARFTLLTAASETGHAQDSETRLRFFSPAETAGLGAVLNGHALEDPDTEWICVAGEGVTVAPASLRALAQTAGHHGLDALGGWGIQRLSHWEAVAAATTADAVTPVLSLNGPFLFVSRRALEQYPFEHLEPAPLPELIHEMTFRMTVLGAWRCAVVSGLAAEVAASAAASGPQLPAWFVRRHGGALPAALQDLEVWWRNLNALRMAAPRLAAVVCHQRPPGRAATFQWHGDTCIAATPEQPVELAPGSATWQLKSGTDTLLFCGIGSGAEVDRALNETSAEVWVIEPEAHLVRHLLCRRDWSRHFMDGRLSISVIPAEQVALAELGLREVADRLRERLFRPRSTVHFIPTASIALNPSVFNDLKQAAQNSVTRSSQRIRPVAAGSYTFDVTVISPSCAIFNDLAQCFGRLGLRTQLYQIPDRADQYGNDQQQQVLKALAAAPSKLVVMRNRCLVESNEPRDPLADESWADAGLVGWWWDVPNVASMTDLMAPHASHVGLAFARDILPLLPQGAEWLPPGARMNFADFDANGVEPETDLSFVGQSRVDLVQSNLRTLCNGLGYFQESLGRTLAADLNRLRGLLQIYRYLRRIYPDLKQRLAGLEPAFPMQAYFLDYLLEMSLTGAFRVAAVEYLSQQGMAPEVYGDEGWVRAGAIPAARFRGLIAPDRLPELYCRSRINLNLNFMQVSSTVNPKVLDVAAVGGVALTDYRPELDVLFPDPACRPFSFRSLEELPGRVGILLNTDLDDYRRRLRSHTRAHHTLVERARWLARRYQLAEHAT